MRQLVPAIMLFLATAALSSGQQPGDFNISYGEGWLVITERSSLETWNVEAATLPIKLVDCERRERCIPGSRCMGLCVWHLQAFATDSQRRAVYFAARTGVGRNTPQIIFRYSLKTRQVTRLTNEYGGGFGKGAVSLQGRYLAYVMYPAEGAVCPPRTWLGIVDMETHRSTGLRPWGLTEVDRGEITELDWNSNTTIAAEVVLREKVCSADGLLSPRIEQYRVDVRDLTFK